jgi:DNA-3-methyladenine glycosylase I
VWAYEPSATGVEPATAAATMSKDLKRRGWAFVGPTTVFSFMQAMGLVNDHLRACQFHADVDRLRGSFQRPE